jgi:quercetin dioxygenase-like cupin family protein
MTTNREVNRTCILALAAFFLSGPAPLLRAQAPSAVPGFTSETLMHEPLGDTSEPKMSLFILNVSPGLIAPAHTHAGAVFAYVLQGDIENQVEPDPPKIYHPGGIFIERPKQVHRFLRNLSNTDPAKILIFQNTGALPATVKPLMQESLPNITRQDVFAIKLVLDAGTSVRRAHQHPGPVFAYVLKGEIESQVDPDPPTVYRTGDVLYEPPMHAHRLVRNLSQTEPAELLIFQVNEEGAPRVIDAQ